MLGDGHPAEAPRPLCAQGRIQPGRRDQAAAEHFGIPAIRDDARGGSRISCRRRTSATHGKCNPLRAWLRLAGTCRICAAIRSSFRRTSSPCPGNQLALFLHHLWATGRNCDRWRRRAACGFTTARQVNGWLVICRPYCCGLTSKSRLRPAGNTDGHRSNGPWMCAALKTSGGFCVMWGCTSERTADVGKALVPESMHSRGGAVDTGHLTRCRWSMGAGRK